MSSKSALNGLSSCKCCPYGFHIDTDFVNYCEALVAALYGSKRLSHSLQYRSNNSLRRKINSAFSALNSSASSTDSFLEYCDYNSNNITAKHKNHANMKSHSSVSRTILLPESAMSDKSLGDVVAKFEETWLESRKRQTNVNNNTNGDNERHLSINESHSPPVSPSSSSCTSSTNLSRVVLSQIREQMASSITRVKELEEQIKHIPNLRQKVIVLREEKKKLLKKLEGDDNFDDNDINNDPQAMNRIRELEKSGLITPPMMRRKLLLKSESDADDDDFGDIWVRTSPPPSKLVSSKNMRLEHIANKIDAINQTSINLLNTSVSTNTENRVNQSMDSWSNTESNFVSNRKLSCETLNSISIEPNPQNEINPKQVLTRSIGISTSLAPSLPRKSVAVETDLKACDTVSLRDIEAKKPPLVSWGTDPIKFQSHNAHSQCTPNTCEIGVKTETIAVKEVATDAHNECILKNSFAQTTNSMSNNKEVQVSEKCPKCELRQTETIGIGDNDIYGMICSDRVNDTFKERPSSLDVLSVSPVSRASSAQSIRLCDKCNEAITLVAKEFIVGPTTEKTPSPTMQSRIPRPIHNTGSLERRTVDDKIIEETQNEILVYKLPKSMSLGSSPIKRHAPPLPPLPPPRRKDYNKNSSQESKIIDDVFKISGISESDESEESSSSSDEGSYEVETGAIAKSAARKRVEPTKEIMAALKVLNDNLIKPEKSNKSATLKSLEIIEKEWFKVSAQSDSDSRVVEDYIDCFETISKHLLNRVVNLDDTSGNTAIHYAISHCNFDIVSVLLDSKVCDVNKPNKAGYTPTMLVSLAKVENETQKAVIRRLFQLGDVNIKAKQNGQTALMLAASHGQFFTCKILMESGAAINMQDNDGSTALMCAAEHGHSDVIRLLLSHPDCDPTIIDNDGSTALKIAMANNNNDIGLMLYASTSMLSRGSSPYASLRRSQSKAIASALRRTGSFSYSRSRAPSHPLQLAASPPNRSRHSSTSTTKSLKN